MRVRIEAETTCGKTWNRVWSIPGIQEATEKAKYEAQNWANYHGLSLKAVHINELDKLDEPVTGKIEELAAPYEGLSVEKLAYVGLLDMGFPLNREVYMEVYNEGNNIGVGINHFHKEVFLIPWLTEHDYEKYRKETEESFLHKLQENEGTN